MTYYVYNVTSLMHPYSYVMLRDGDVEGKNLWFGEVQHLPEEASNWTVTEIEAPYHENGLEGEYTALVIVIEEGEGRRLECEYLDDYESELE